MKSKAWIGVIVVVVILAAAAAFYFNAQRPPTPPAIDGQQPGTTGEPIGIGVIAPLTGEGATYGSAMKRGFDLAFEGNPNIKLIYEDDKLSVSDGVAAINKLINADKVKIVLGSAASSVTLAIAPIAEKNKVILFSPISTTDELRTSGEYIFRNVPRNEIQGITGAEFLINHLRKKDAAILKKNDEYATNLSLSFKKRFLELGGTILFDEAYAPATTDFRTTISKIKGQKPEAVYIPGNYEEVAAFLKQAHEAGLSAIFLGGDGSYSPELVKIAGNAAEGSYYTMMTVKQNAYHTSFKAAFLAKYSREPDIWDAYSYEAGKIISESISKVGNDPSAIKTYLLSTTFDSMTGSLKFDSDGEVDRKFGILQVRNGQFADVEW